MNFNQGGTINPKPPRVLNPKEKKFARNIIITVIALIILFAAGSSCWYEVTDKQKAVVTTFGKVTDVTSAGIHLKAPFGIQKAYPVNVNMSQKIEIGYISDGTGKSISNDAESKMITGDYNIVNVDFFVEYKISDANPEKYLFSSYNPEGILKNLVQSQIRTVISSYKVDDILTTKKSEIQAAVKERILVELEKYDIGLYLTDIKIQDAEAPTEEVIEAFKSVETAKQNKETTLNDAKAYENAKIPEANAEAHQLIANAEYLKQNRINDAIKQVAMFEAMYNEYKLNPLITRQRMYYEALEAVMPGVKVFIDTSESGTQTLLPLESFMSDGSQGGN